MRRDGRRDTRTLRETDKFRNRGGPKLLHGADVVSPVVAFEPESFEFAVADFDGREFGFPINP